MVLGLILLYIPPTAKPAVTFVPIETDEEAAHLEAANMSVGNAQGCGP